GRRLSSCAYRGRAQKIVSTLPVRALAADDRATLTELFEAAYRRLYSRAIPGVDIEILSWVVSVAAPAEGRLAEPSSERAYDPPPRARRRVFDPDSGEFLDVAVYWRPDLAPGAPIPGPAVIAEDEDTTARS